MEDNIYLRLRKALIIEREILKEMLISLDARIEWVEKRINN